MSWVKVDDGYPDHPKIIAAGPLAAWLDLCGICYCARMLTDGLIPKAQVPRLVHTRGAMALAARLVEVGRWEDRGDFFAVHDYLIYNPSRQEVTEMREKVRRQRSEAGLQSSVKRRAKFGTAQPCKLKVSNEPFGRSFEPRPVPSPTPTPARSSALARVGEEPDDAALRAAAASLGIPIRQLKRLLNNFGVEEITLAKHECDARIPPPDVARWDCYLPRVIAGLRSRPVEQAGANGFQPRCSKADPTVWDKQAEMRYQAFLDRKAADERTRADSKPMPEHLRGKPPQRKEDPT